MADQTMTGFVSLRGTDGGNGGGRERVSRLQDHVQRLPIGAAFALDVLGAGQFSRRTLAPQFFQRENPDVLSLSAHIVIHKGRF